MRSPPPSEFSLMICSALFLEKDNFWISCSSILSSIKGGFPQQGPRPTCECDCISGPRLIPAVSWGHPAHIMRALPHVGLPISRNQEDAQPHHHGSWASEPHSIATHDACPLDLTLRVVRFPPPHTPLDYSSFRNWRQKPAQSRRTIGAQ